MTAGCASLALKQPGLLPIFDRGGKLPVRFKPGQEFWVNWHHGIRYLATAIAAGADVGAVRPAWHSLVQAFPTLQATEGRNEPVLGWEDLLLLAYAFTKHLEGADTSHVADNLHALVIHLAATEHPTGMPDEHRRALGMKD